MKTKLRFAVVAPASGILVSGLWLGMAPRAELPADAGREIGAVDVVAERSPALEPQSTGRRDLLAPDTAVSREKPGDDAAGPSGASDELPVSPSPPRPDMASPRLVAGLVDGRWVTQGDILVDESRLRDDDGASDVRTATFDDVQYWPVGVVPYVVDAGVDKTRLAAALADVHGRTTVRFIERTSEDDYLVFRPADGDRCQSHLGRLGGEQEILLAPSCTAGQILHELMHCLGFVHEHSRDDRDEHVTIVWDDIDPAYRNQFQKLPVQVSMPVPSPFDFDSVLLYPQTAFGGEKRTIMKKDGGAYTANRRRLSDLDVARINRLYAE